MLSLKLCRFCYTALFINFFFFKIYFIKNDPSLLPPKTKPQNKYNPRFFGNHSTLIIQSYHNVLIVIKQSKINASFCNGELLSGYCDLHLQSLRQRPKLCFQTWSKHHSHTAMSHLPRRDCALSKIFSVLRCRFINRVFWSSMELYGTT